MNLYKGTKPKSNKSNILTPIWRSWNMEETATLTNATTTKKTKQNVKSVPRSRSSNVVERKHGKGIRIPSKHSEEPRQAQPSKSWVQTKPRIKPSVSLKYGLFLQPRKVQSPNRVNLLSRTRLRGPNTRLWSPTRHHTGMNCQRANIVREKTRANVERGDRDVKINVKKEGARAATKKGSSHYSVVPRAPPPPKLGLSDTMHLDIKPGKGRIVIPRR